MSESFIPHIPAYYVAGMFSQTDDAWYGRFHLKANELLEYAELDAQTVAEYDACICMLAAQQVYEHWWKKVQIK